MTTIIRKIEAGSDIGRTIQEAADCLARGGLVAFPTETVYGLGANAADPEAVARLREVKQRPDTRPFTVHIGSRSEVDRFVPELRGLARRLVQKAWPGPLTVIFQVDRVETAAILRETAPEHASAMYHEGTIGMRCPDDRVAADLLIRAAVPVVAASANPAGAPAPVDAEEVAAALDGQIDLILDAGRARYGVASTIVRAGETDYELLREGVIDERTLRRLANLHFLLICSGNTCRSPMAEGLLRKLLSERLQCDEKDLAERGIHIESAGVATFSGARVSPLAVHALKHRGIDISGHRSEPATLEVLNRADYIFTMTMDHRETVVALSPAAAERCRPLAEEDIQDPIGGDEATYNSCALAIEEALRRRIEEIPL